MTVDYTNDLYEFCSKYKIQLIGNYTNVKNKTMIHFNCKCCKTEIKKSYEFLTRYKDYDNVAPYSGICSRCFKNMMH